MALLGKSEIDKSLVSHDSYSDILESSNEILRPKNCETASVGQGVRKSVFGKALYLAMLTRFSSINSLITGLACIMCRIRKVPREHAGNLNHVTRQAWEKLLRSSQLYYPPENCKQMIPELSKAGILTTKNRLSLYSLIRFHKAGSMGIISHKDTNLCRILLLRAHQSVESGSDIHLAANLTRTRLRMGRLAVAVTRESVVVRRFIQGCIECRKSKFAVEPYKMGPRQFVHDVTFGMGIFSHINCDIVGHFCYATGKLTRRNQAHKVSVLAIICLYSKGLSLILMQDYSSVSFNPILHGGGPKCPKVF